MSRFVSVFAYLILFLYICTLVLVYVLPLFDFQFLEVEVDNDSLNLSSGDSLLVYPKDIEKIKESNIIAYTNFGGEMNIHKVDSVNLSARSIKVTISENQVRDLTGTVPYSNVLGVKVLTLHGCASLVEFLNNFMGKVLAFGVFAMILLIKVGFGSKKDRV